MTNNVTPADVEYVPVTSIAVTDILVQGFHTARQHDNEAPTQRQLNRATFTVVTTVDRAITARGHEVVEINIALSSRTTVLVHNPHANATTCVWRIKRAGA